MRNVLVATDFSHASARSRDYAVALAGPGASMTLVHAELLPIPTWSDADYLPDWMAPEPGVREQTAERLHLFARPARAAGLSVKTVLREGLPADVILAQAAALRPDLIAMGTHGRRGFERWLLGSTAERVMRLASAPVLTVPEQARPAPSRVRELLCPLSLSSGPTALAVAHDIAAACGSGLTAVHVLECPPWLPPDGWTESVVRDRLSDVLATDGPGVAVETLVRTGRPSREILRLAHDRAADVIVMGLHDRCLGDQGLFGSTAEQVIREAECAVITVRPVVEAASMRQALEPRCRSRRVEA